MFADCLVAPDSNTAAASSRFPVDIFYIVARNVFAQIIEIETVPLEDRAVLTVQQTPHLFVGVEIHLGFDFGEKTWHITAQEQR